MSEIRLIRGEVFADHRGRLTHFNAFDFRGVSRYYIIEHSETSVIRGWHGHQYEGKWFECLRGSFVCSFVKVDNWDNPSPDLQPEVFRMSADEPTLLCLPRGYANCIRATAPDSQLLVYSEKPLEEAKMDSWRWEPAMWGGDKI